jgi:hypothetical protein
MRGTGRFAVRCCACAQARARVRGTPRVTHSQADRMDAAEALPTSVGASDGDGVAATEGLAVAGARVSPTLVGAAAANAPMKTRRQAAELQRKEEPKGSTGRALQATQRLASGITAAGDVRVEVDAAVTSETVEPAVAPCRVAAFVFAAIVG